MFFWSPRKSFSNLMPGVTIRSNKFVVLAISDAGQITPSKFESFAIWNSFSTILLVLESTALLVRALLTPRRFKSLLFLFTASDNASCPDDICKVK